MAESSKGQDPTAKAQQPAAEESPQTRQSAGERRKDAQLAAENQPTRETGRGETPTTGAGESQAQPVPGVGGLREATQALHAARVSVPGHDNVDARLDNRSGPFRPPLEEFPAKPQQIDGPDLIHQVEHTRRTLDAVEDPGPVKGMFSPGPHGLSDEDMREGPTTFGSEGLTVEEAGQGRPTA
jgi:hypothetical protein